MIFDLWVENEDRTLTALGGNPNLLWNTDVSELYVIDHNLIFDSKFNKANFWAAHVFKSEYCNKQDDFFEKLDFERRLQIALDSWQSAWDTGGLDVDLYAELIRSREDIIRFSDSRVLFSTDPVATVEQLFEHYVQRSFAHEPSYDENMKKQIREL